MAAALADATPEMEKACANYALHLGNAFQIADDILDYSGEAVNTGKNIGADLREGKVTLPLLYAMRDANEIDRVLIEDAIRDGDGDFTAISRIIRETNAIEKCQKKALEEANLGKNAINLLPSGLFRESLIKFLAFAVERDR